MNDRDQYGEPTPAAGSDFATERYARSPEFIPTEALPQADSGQATERFDVTEPYQPTLRMPEAGQSATVPFAPAERPRYDPNQQTQVFGAPAHAPGRPAAPGPSRADYRDLMAPSSAPPYQGPPVRVVNEPSGFVSLGVTGWVRLVIAVPILLLGTILAMTALASAVSAGDIGGQFGVLGVVATGVQLIGWLVLPGSVGGHFGGIALAVLAHTAISLAAWFDPATPVGQFADEGTRGVLNAVALPTLGLVCAAGAWISARGKPAKVGLALVIPLGFALFTALAVPGGWFTGELPSFWMTWVTDLANGLRPLLGWNAEMVDALPRGIDLAARLIVPMLPVVILASPFRRRRGPTYVA